MIGMMVRWFVLTISVWAATAIVPGLSYTRWQDLLLAALVLGILNSLVKAVRQLISLPFILLSLGFFLLAINALLLGLTAYLVRGFHVAGFWSAVAGSVVISLVSMLLGTSNRKPRSRVHMSPPPPPAGRQGPPPGRGPIIDV